MATASEIKRILSEVSALDELIWAKKRRAARELLRLRALHPNDWRRMAGIDSRTAAALLQSINER